MTSAVQRRPNRAPTGKIGALATWTPDTLSGASGTVLVARPGDREPTGNWFRSQLPAGVGVGVAVQVETRVAMRVSVVVRVADDAEARSNGPADTADS